MVGAIYQEGYLICEFHKLDLPLLDVTLDCLVT